MGVLTRWLVRQKASRSFLSLVWAGYLILAAIGTTTVFYTVQTERSHWRRFFTASVELFGFLAESAGHAQIEFSYSLWSKPIFPVGTSAGSLSGSELPQPDTQYSNRPLKIPESFRIVSGSAADAPFELRWESADGANTYEVQYLAEPDETNRKTKWETVYQGTETHCSGKEAGWYRVRSLFITPPDDPVYRKISDLLIDAAKLVPDIGSVYTMRDYSGDEYIFAVCPEMDADKNGVIDPETERLAPLGEPYSHANSMVILPGERKPSITPLPVTDEWGTWFSAVMPIYRDDGIRDGYIAVDYPVAKWKQNIQRSQLTYTVCLLIVFTLFICGTVQMMNLRTAAVKQTETLNMLSQTIDELTVAKQTAESAARAKSHFLTNMSHEIRTPMNAVLGFADILGRRLLDCCPQDQLADNKQTIAMVEKSGFDLLTIINDILDISKIDTDQIEIEWEPVQPRRIVADVQNAMNLWLREKPGISFQMEMADSVPQWVFGDSTRFRQILRNIGNNAVKFSEHGTIRLQCKYLRYPNTAANVKKIKRLYGQEVNTGLFPPESDIMLLQFIVQDEGIGIPLDYQAAIFQPFSQADSGLTRKYGGAGLGLSISKRLAVLMGGDITVQSMENHGSTFRITLAVSEMPPMPNNPNISGIVLVDSLVKPLAGKRVLVAEDGKINQIVITKMLQEAGAAVFLAENGKLAVEAVEAAADLPEHAFDAILMDMQMPVMDGYEATFRLRQNGFTKPIIAVTAHALTGDCEKTLDIGCNAHLSKPIDRNKLISTILKFDTAAVALQ